MVLLEYCYSAIWTMELQFAIGQRFRLCCEMHEHVLQSLYELQQDRIAARCAPCVLQVNAKVNCSITLGNLVGKRIHDGL